MIKVTYICDGCGAKTHNLQASAWIIEEGKTDLPSVEKKPPKYHFCQTCAGFINSFNSLKNNSPLNEI